MRELKQEPKPLAQSSVLSAVQSFFSHWPLTSFIMFISTFCVHSLIIWPSGNGLVSQCSVFLISLVEAEGIVFLQRTLFGAEGFEMPSLGLQREQGFSSQKI